MSICEQCGREHDGNFGSGRFCCRSCSNKWVALHQSDEAIARKVEKGIKNLTDEGRKLGQGHKFTDSDRVKSVSARKNSLCKKRHDWLLSVLDGTVTAYRGSYQRFRERLIEFGYKEAKCESCGLSLWLNKPLSLEVHHKDGDSNNNSITNIQLLCPNCHSMTSNYRWRKSNKKSSTR